MKEDVSQILIRGRKFINVNLENYWQTFYCGPFIRIFYTKNHNKLWNDEFLKFYHFYCKRIGIENLSHSRKCIKSFEKSINNIENVSNVLMNMQEVLEKFYNIFVNI